MGRKHSRKPSKLAPIDRRTFLAGAALGGVTAVSAMTAPAVAVAQEAGERTRPPPPNQDAEQGVPSQVQAGKERRSAPAAVALPGSDYMVDVIRSLGIEYIAFIPGDTFKGLHESVINYGMLTAPKLQPIACMHEEVSVAICHGYSKIAGKPMACMMHSTVGLQHGSMALYNAWADRVPVFAIVGHQADADRRVGPVQWQHAVYDGPELVRDFTKFDDTPVTLADFADSAVRAYKLAMTPPYEPVLLALDEDLQEDPAPGGAAPPIPREPRLVPPQGEEGACEDIAKMLLAADNPVIMADRCARTPAGLSRLIELAEALQAPVVDAYGRFNFPWRHPLNQTRNARYLLSRADLVVGLEMTDFYHASAAANKSAKRISIASTDLYLKSNYQDFERFTAVDIAVAADAEATLPALTEAVRRLMPDGRRATLYQRGASFARDHADALAQSRAAAAVSWDDVPISTARLCMELYDQIRNEDWSLVNGTNFQSYWPQQLWTADKHYQYIGDAGAYGLGYLPGASLGAAIANQPHGRLTVAIGGDGDLMFTPSFLWTAAHHRIPILYIVHNNRAYHQETMWVQVQANLRQRGIDRAHIGTTIDDPYIDYAKLADSMGVHGEGPVTDPNQLGSVLKRAVALVKRGQPVLVDVVAQGR
jgi:thiamine pyrophosphate-dependent acetolactate synthase large subunit-like protein